MGKIYSTYEAKARFSEILRKVRAGEHVTIAYRGETVAEIRPVYRADRVERALAELERDGVLSPAAAPEGALSPVVTRPGALGRFLEDRE